jgi:hypothetical protein
MLPVLLLVLLAAFHKQYFRAPYSDSLSLRLQNFHP